MKKISICFTLLFTNACMTDTSIKSPTLLASEVHEPEVKEQVYTNTEPSLQDYKNGKKSDSPISLDYTKVKNLFE